MDKPATPDEWRAAYDLKVQDFARETARASRLRMALDDLDALNPDDFRSGQDHLPPAFREVNYRDAVLHISKIVDVALAADAPVAALGANGYVVVPRHEWEALLDAADLSGDTFPNDAMLDDLETARAAVVEAVGPTREDTK